MKSPLNALRFLRNFSGDVHQQGVDCSSFLGINPRRGLEAGLQVVMVLGVGVVFAAPLKAEPEPGWSEWQRRDPQTETSFDTGFFNHELRRFAAFEQACQTTLGEDNKPMNHWFRLSTLVPQLGTGLVEYGCQDSTGAFVHTVTMTAIAPQLDPVDCLQVNSPISNGLNVRAWPGDSEQIVGGVANGTQLDPGGFPASITEVDGRNWVAIVSPVTGWVSNGQPGSEGNLNLCPVDDERR
ncbi:MAG: SH3 domain-containing protein [Leptolyngbya sp. DLM2.Bin15]|nr:MAG: SH3 domain-containing protein [Leptolyngbya sp. DLM2.Bin15]